MPTATAFDESFGALAIEMIEEFGRTLVLRKATRVEVTTGATAGSVATSPLSTSALLLNGAVSAGLSTVDLDAAAVSGLLVAGDTLTIGGVAYTVTGGPYAASGNAIEDVTLAAPLEADAANDDPVTVTFSGSDYTVKGVIEDLSRNLVDGQVTKVGDLSVLIARQSMEALGVEISNEDDLFLGADPLTAPLAEIVAVRPIASGEFDACYRVIARLRV